MKDEAINSIMKKYAREHLSPTKEERDYVSDKYNTIKDILKGSCFKAGSFARFTAIRPLHDLDVIWITDNQDVMDAPAEVLRQLANDMQAAYNKLSGEKPKIEAQTHSVTLLFGDIASEDGFSIDIVPAIHSFDPELKNKEFDDPILIVPEVIKMNHVHRAAFYAKQKSDEIVNWIYTDPKGYINIATSLDDETDGSYRKSVKIIKAWRGGLKKSMGDDWKLKSFNVEQICAEVYGADTSMSILDTIRNVFSELPSYIVNAPLIEDRAYAQLEDDKYIDEYLADPSRVSDADKKTILEHIRNADILIGKLPACKNESEVVNLLSQLTSRSERAPIVSSKPQQTTYTSPARPYARG